MLWLLLFFFPNDSDKLDVALNIYLCVIYVVAAIGFVVYGGRLYMMLKHFPIESRGRSNKLKEVGWVSGICTSCFLLRVGLLIFSTMTSLEDSQDWFVGCYYGLVEVVPSLLVLFILRKLPSKKGDTRPVSTVTTPFLKPSDRYDAEHYKVNLDIN